MKLHAEKTERGWELADETGTFEHETTSEVFATKKMAQEAAKRANMAPGTRDCTNHLYGE